MSDQQSPAERVAHNLLPVARIAGENLRWTMVERLAHYHCPGVSVAVIETGELAWAAGYGAIEDGKPGRVNADTMFSGASISKPVTAMLALQMVERGVFDLDTGCQSLPEVVAGSGQRVHAAKPGHLAASAEPPCGNDGSRVWRIHTGRPHPKSARYSYRQDHVPKRPHDEWRHGGQASRGDRALFRRRHHDRGADARRCDRQTIS